MKTADAKKIADTAVQELAEQLAQGRSEALIQYLDTMARFHHYSWHNVMMILSQRPDASRVAGFRTWKKLDRFVKRGEKGIAIFVPIRVKATDPVTDEEKKVLRFKVGYVFDIAQTEGEPLADYEIARSSGDPGEHLDTLKSFVASQEIELHYAGNLGGAEGVSKGGRIDILESLSPAEEFAVLAHEIAHEMMHRGEDRATLTKTVKETEAEAVAYVVCKAVGIESPGSADYVLMYQGDADTLGESLERIQRAAARVMTAITADRDNVEPQ
ncbi:MAG: DUF1738 domain-containing protein [Phycisphaera sp.]|nr:DUF1738 domain-containing protein [Phycisphaera sp.]